MKYITILRLHHLLLACLLIFSINVCAEEVTTTYSFNSDNWGSTNGNWISGKKGAGYNNSGVQVTASSSLAYATSPDSFKKISKIVVTYCTNKNAGTGNIVAYVGGAFLSAQNTTVPKDNGTTARTIVFDTENSMSGKVLIGVSCSENSIYIQKVEITHEGIINESEITGEKKATFTFNTDLGLAILGVNKSEIPNGGKIINNDSFRIGAITMTAPDGSYFYKSSSATNLRVSRGRQLILTGENCLITKVEFTGSPLNNLGINDDKGYFTSNDQNDRIWEGSESSVSFTEATNISEVIVYTITVTYTDNITPPVPETADFSISSVGYATYYNAFPYVMPEGVEGKAMVLENGAVRSKTVFNAGDVVPAETALLLKGTSKSYTITKTDAPETISAEGNLLHGLLVEGTTTGGSDGARYYKLANGENGLGWYYGSADNSDGSAFTSGANKAYLVLEAADYNSIAHARNFFSIDEDATVVTNPKTVERDNRTFFNLMGQRTSADAKGIVIVNGKKVLNK